MATRWQHWPQAAFTAVGELLDFQMNLCQRNHCIDHMATYVNLLWHILYMYVLKTWYLGLPPVLTWILQVRLERLFSVQSGNYPTAELRNKGSNNPALLTFFLSFARPDSVSVPKAGCISSVTWRSRGTGEVLRNWGAETHQRGSWSWAVRFHMHARNAETLPRWEDAQKTKRFIYVYEYQAV